MGFLHVYLKLKNKKNYYIVKLECKDFLFILAAGSWWKQVFAKVLLFPYANLCEENTCYLIIYKKNVKVDLLFKYICNNKL